MKKKIDKMDFIKILSPRSLKNTAKENEKTSQRPKKIISKLYLSLIKDVFPECTKKSKNSRKKKNHLIFKGAKI